MPAGDAKVVVEKLSGLQGISQCWPWGPERAWCRGEWSLVVPWERGEGVGLYLASVGSGGVWGQPCLTCHPDRVQVSAWPYAQGAAAGQQTGIVSGCLLPAGQLLCFCPAPAAPAQPLGLRSCLGTSLVAHGSTRASSCPLGGTPAVGFGRVRGAVDVPAGHGNVLLWGFPLSCFVLAGGAVPGGSRAGTGPCGAILWAVPAPAWCHGGAFWAAGCLCAGPVPGLCRGIAAALLPYCPARELRDCGTGAGAPASLALGTGWGGCPGPGPQVKLQVGNVLAPHRATEPCPLAALDGAQLCVHSTCHGMAPAPVRSCLRLVPV